MPGDRESLDLLLADMAGHQANHVGETTPALNHALAAEVLERIDRKEAEQPAPFIADLPPVPPPAVVPPGGMRIVKEAELGPDIDPRAAWSRRTLERYAKVKTRLELLITKTETGPLGQPSWHQRVMSVLALRFAPPELAKTAAHQMAALIEESNAVFGPWWAERPRKVMVG